MLSGSKDDQKITSTSSKHHLAVNLPPSKVDLELIGRSVANHELGSPTTPSS